jgi:hypothetical protein
MTRRLKTTEVLPVREALVKHQKVCPLCQRKFGAKVKPALDHCHVRGHIRDVLCINCNGMEGKVFNLARRARADGTEIEWLERLVAYWIRHQTSQHRGLIHPSFKTEAEKKLARNKKARDRRAKLKEQ